MAWKPRINKPLTWLPTFNSPEKGRPTAPQRAAASGSYLGLSSEEARAASVLGLPYGAVPESQKTLISEEVTRLQTLDKKRQKEKAGQDTMGRAATLLTQKSKNKTLLG